MGRLRKEMRSTQSYQRGRLKMRCDYSEGSSARVVSPFARLLAHPLCSITLLMFSSSAYANNDSEPARTKVRAMPARPAGKIFIPGCQTGSTESAKTGQDQKDLVHVTGARVISTARSGNKLLLTFEGVYGDLLRIYKPDAATANWLKQFPRAVTYEIKLQNNESPPLLQEGAMIDLDIKHRQELVTQSSGDEFPSISRMVDASFISSIRKSSLDPDCRPWLVLEHLRNYDMAGEYVYSDGTVIAFESLNPQISASGKLSAEKLENLRKLMKACNFEKLSSTRDGIPIYGGEYICNSKRQFIAFDSAPPAKAPSVTVPEAQKAKLIKEAKAAKDLLAQLSDYHKSILESASVKLVYTQKFKRNELASPYNTTYDKSGKPHTEGTHIYAIASAFPNIPGLTLSEIDPVRGLPITQATFKKHARLLDNMNLNVTHQYWKQGNFAYRLELHYSLIPSKVL